MPKGLVKENLLEQLKSLPYFSKATLLQLAKQYDLKLTTVDTYISQFLRYSELFQLKKGLYVSVDFFNKAKGDISYLFYLANILRTPSYVSSWTALQYYNLTTESIYGVTSITPKVTRTYQTKMGVFSYQSMKRELFSDFVLIRGVSASAMLNSALSEGENSAQAGRFDFFIASPPKALFDLLYLKTHQFRGIRFNEVRSLVEEMRIDIEEMSKKDQNIFYSMVKKFVS